MLKWLSQGLNRFLKHLFGRQQTHTAKEYKVVEKPPELTNADLEFLFTQLLEGVQQAQGRQWVLKYLQRMENRIPIERWLNWLLMFGERLLTSPAPNHQLAKQMVQLGELGIGRIGELAYNIGIQMLQRDALTEYEDDEEQDQVDRTTPQESILNSPGLELIRKYGDRLWDYDEAEEARAMTPVPEVLAGNKPETTVVGTHHRGEDEDFWDLMVEEPTAAEVDQINSLLDLIFEEPTAAEVEQMDSFWDLMTEEPLPAPREQSLVNLDHKATSVPDDLLVRLDQDGDRVQQLAGELTTTDQGPTFFYQGLQQVKARDLLGAIRFYDQAIQQQQNCYEYWLNRGLTLFHLGNFAEAITAYDQAIELKPNSYQAWYNRGGTCGELGDFEGAIACFERAIEIQPHYPEPWSRKGSALLKLGLLWEAIANYDQAINLRPQDPENWYYRGIALAVAEQYSEAIAAYNQAVYIQPDYHEVWIDRGVVLFNLGQWAEAISSWDQALSIQPNLYLAWFNRGVALDNLGHREEAIASYQQAITIKPDFHLAWYNQAVALFHLEHFAAAITCYDSALQIKQDYWEAWLGRATSAGHLSPGTSSIVSINTNKPALRLGGHIGKLASLEEGLRYLRPDTHPEGWGRLHLAIANTYYDQGRKHPRPREYWHQAVAEYDQALLTLTTEDFPKLHLEVLQSLAKVLVGLGYTTPALELQQRGIHLLRQLLDEPTSTDESKKQLALKFAGLGQLAVDIVVDAGDLVEAWEFAEQGKNTCLTWLLSGWSEEIYSPSYGSVQQLLNPTTAIIYWHLSPASLHTFIIKDAAPSPILLFTPVQDAGSIPELPLPEAVQRLLEFENWLEDWQQQYQAYCQPTSDQESKTHHAWRVEMEARLLNLGNILNVPTIAQELEGITQLILIPHRDLHTLPIHALFHLSPSPQELPGLVPNCTITYLPSIEVGLSLKPEPEWYSQEQTLLNVEQPYNADFPPLKSANLTTGTISQLFPRCDHIQGLQVTKDQVVTALAAGYNIFHFTGYAINNSSDHQKSELLLTGKEKLTLEEICQQSLASYDLFTLPTTVTPNPGASPSGKPTHSSEYVGLVTGLLSRGVPHVVSSIWTGEPCVSALVIIEFYRRLQSNTSPATALAAATLWLRELTVGEIRIWYEELLNHLPPEEFRIKNYIATELYRISKLAPEEKLYHHPYYWAALAIAGRLNPLSSL